MDRQTIATSVAPEVIIEQIHGNLQVKGWDRPEVEVQGNIDELTLEEEEDAVRISSRGNCVIRLPQAAAVHVERVHGEARFKLLEDQLLVEEVMGSLFLRNVADPRVERVHGNLTAKQIQGDLSVEEVAGNAMVRAVRGSCTIDSVGGNLDVRDVEGGMAAAVDGNIQARFGVITGDDYQIHADGNVYCRVPEDAGLAVDLTSEAESIRIKLPNEARHVRIEPSSDPDDFEADHHALVLGTGTARMQIQAGGAVTFSAEPLSWQEKEARDMDWNEEGVNYTDQIGEQIEAQIAAQMEALNRQLNEQLKGLSASIGGAGLSPEQSEQIIRKARESSERATARAEEKMRRTQEKLEMKLEAARRRSELKARAAERRAHGRTGKSWTFGWSSTPSPKEPVSDEERLLILKMLEQKKITWEEADALLSALEGNE